MKMKTILLLALMGVTSVAFSQTSNLRRAKTSYNKYNDLKALGSAALSSGDLTAAKAAIDKAAEHEKTKELAETWTYYALIHADLALIDSTEAAASLYQEAVEGLEKAKALDTENENEANLSSLNSMLAQYELNKGAKSWDEQDFQGAYAAFEKGLEYLPGDTTLLYYAGVAAINNQDYKSAVDKYTQLVPVDSFSNNKQIVLDASRLYLQLGDTTNALKYAEIGTQKYPEDEEIATHNIELNLMAGNEQGIINTLSEQAAKSPDDKTLQYYLGIAHASLKNDDEAIEAYKKALAIDPNYLEANINLGAAILTKGINRYNQANNSNLPRAEYDAEMKEVYEIFDSALPYLEKAVELDGNSSIALINLKQYYEIKDDHEKAKELQERLDALK